MSLLAKLTQSLALLFLGAASLGAADQGSLAFRVTKVQVVPVGAFAGYWKARGAELRETFTATSGYIQIEDISPTAMEDAKFYGEYFDAAGRFCFSLVFSQAKNESNQSGPFAPGEVRTVVSMAASLAPAAEPTMMRLYSVEQRPVGEQKEVIYDESVVRSPTAIMGGVEAGRGRLWLERELPKAEGPVLDLVLARAEVDSAGRLDRVKVLKAVSSEVEAWFRDFVSRARFTPASRGGLTEGSGTVLLARAVLSLAATQESPFLPRQSPWVKAYAEGLAGTEIPSINELRFERRPTRVKRLGSLSWVELPPLPPGLFEYHASGSDWCPDVVKWFTDPASGQLRWAWEGSTEAH